MPPNKILSILKEIDYIIVKEPILKSLGSKKIVGWNVNAPSVLRKTFTVERLLEEITESRLPLIVEDKNEWQNYFKVYLV